MQATEPDGAYCADQPSADAYRLCGLVVEGLYGFAPGTLTVEPRLAQRCEPDAEALVWTCRLRQGATFSDGSRVDAGDVLASYVAQWDTSQPLRRDSEAPFAAWTELFGDTIGRVARGRSRRPVLLDEDPLHQRGLLDGIGEQRPDVASYASSPLAICWLPAAIPAASPAVIESRSFVAPGEHVGQRGVVGRRQLDRRRVVRGSDRPGTAASRAPWSGRRPRPTSLRGPGSRPTRRGPPRRPGRRGPTCRAGARPRRRRRATRSGWAARHRRTPAANRRGRATQARPSGAGGRPARRDEQRRTSRMAARDRRLAGRGRRDAGPGSFALGGRHDDRRSLGDGLGHRGRVDVLGPVAGDLVALPARTAAAAARWSSSSRGCPAARGASSGCGTGSPTAGPRATARRP